MQLQHHDIKKTKPNVTCTAKHTLGFPEKTVNVPHTPNSTLRIPHSTHPCSPLYASRSQLFMLTLHAPHSTGGPLFTNNALHVLHFTIYTTLPIPHSTLDTSRSPLAPLFMPHAPHSKSTLYIPHSTLYTWHLALHALYTSQNILDFTLHAPHSTLHKLIAHCTSHSAFQTLYFTSRLYTSHSALHSIHYTVYTLHFHTLST